MTANGEWEWEQMAECGRLARRYGHIEIVYDKHRKAGHQYGIKRLYSDPEAEPTPVTVLDPEPEPEPEPVSDSLEERMIELGVEYRVGDPAFEEPWEKFLIIHRRAGGDLPEALDSCAVTGYRNKRAYVNDTVKAYELRHGIIVIER